MIQIIVTAFAFSFFITELSGWIKPNSWLWRKPFNCLTCLSAWSALALYFMPDYLKDASFVMFITPPVAILLKNLFKNIYTKTITK